jgi:hypothetical protein
MSVFPPWRVAQRRGRFLAASIGSLVRSRLHQEHLVTLTARFVAARIEIVSSAPREKARLTAIRDVFLRGTFERRTSSRREPFRFSERAVSQRTSIPWALPPWSDETPPFTRTSATPSLATTMRSLPRASPCLRVFCGVPYGRRRRRRFFGLRRSCRILQHELTHGHDLTGCFAPLPLGTRCPDFVHGRSRLRGRPCGEPCRSA